MNLGQYVSLLSDCTKADTQLGIFPTYVNIALKQLQRRRSWLGMKSQIAFTIPSGNGQATLPTTFKEPQSGLNALRAQSVLTPTGYDMWYLYSKQELERLGVIGVGAPDNKAYIDYDGTNHIIVTLGQVGNDTNFLLDAYSFFPDLVANADENYLTREYPLLVLEQAKVYAFRHGGMDDGTGERMMQMADTAQSEVERLYELAIRDDGYRLVRGRRFRMGGY